MFQNVLQKHSILKHCYQCDSELLQLLQIFYLLFCTEHVTVHFNFHGIAINLFDIVFMFVTLY